MRSTQAIALASFTGSLALAGLGLGLIIRSDIGHGRMIMEHEAAVGETRRLMRAEALEKRLRRLERVAATQRGEC